MAWESDLMQIITCKFLISTKEFHSKDNSKFKSSKNHNTYLPLITNFRKSAKSLKIKLNRLI